MNAHCDKKGLMPIPDAIAHLLAVAKAFNLAVTTHRVPLIDAVGMTLAEDIVSPINVPPTDNSAMDGYALIASDSNETLFLQQIGQSLAGHPYTGSVAEGECVRIMTGAPIPKGANAVVMQENTEVKNHIVQINGPIAAGSNVRKKGESIQQGQVVMNRGSKLNAAQIALIGSLGQGTVQVFKPITIGVMATGDELMSPGNIYKEGHIYESNRLMIMAMIKQLGMDTIDFGIIPDTLDATRDALIQANEKCDVVITSGGVSVGDADFVKKALEDIGHIDFWQVAIKPGKPFAFGRLSHALFCGLPGNPVSSYVTFQQLVIPLLHALQKQDAQPQLRVNAIAETMIKKQPGRTDFQRGIFTQNEDGQIRVKPNGPQGSGIMTSLNNANCYIVVPADKGIIKAEEIVQIIPFASYCG